MMLGATDLTGKLDILRHDGNPPGVDGAQVGVFEQRHQVGLGSFLHGNERAALETNAPDKVQIDGNFTNEALEGKFTDQEISGLLVSTDLAKSDGTCKSKLSMLWQNFEY